MSEDQVERLLRGVLAEFMPMEIELLAVNGFESSISGRRMSGFACMREIAEYWERAWSRETVDSYEARLYLRKHILGWAKAQLESESWRLKRPTGM